MEPPPDTTLLWCLERCLEEPELSNQAIADLIALISPTGLEGLPQLLQCRVVLRAIEGEARAGQLSTDTAQSLELLAELSDRVQAPGVDARRLVCSPQLLLEVQTGVFIQALAERLYSKQEDLLPHLEALFPEPRPDQMQRVHELVDGTDDAADRRALVMRHPLDPVLLALLRFVEDGRAALGPSLLSVINEDINAGRYLPGALQQPAPPLLPPAPPAEQGASGSLLAAISGKGRRCAPLQAQQASGARPSAAAAPILSINAGVTGRGATFWGPALQSQRPNPLQRPPPIASPSSQRHLPPSFQRPPSGGGAASPGPRALSAGGFAAAGARVPSPVRSYGGGRVRDSSREEDRGKGRDGSRDKDSSRERAAQAEQARKRARLEAEGQRAQQQRDQQWRQQQQHQQPEGGGEMEEEEDLELPAPEGPARRLQEDLDVLHDTGGEDPRDWAVAAAGEAAAAVAANEEAQGTPARSARKEEWRRQVAGRGVTKEWGSPDSDERPRPQMPSIPGRRPTLHLTAVRSPGGGAGAGSPLLDHPPGSRAAQQGKQRRKVGRWSEQETATLLELLVEYGEGAWARMETDSRAREHMPHRSQVDMKDKWRNLRKQGMGEELAEMRRQWLAKEVEQDEEVEAERERREAEAREREGEEDSEGEAEGAEGEGAQQQQQQQQQEEGSDGEEEHPEGLEAAGEEEGVQQPEGQGGAELPHGEWHDAKRKKAGSKRKQQQEQEQGGGDEESGGQGGSSRRGVSTRSQQQQQQQQQQRSRSQGTAGKSEQAGGKSQSQQQQQQQGGRGRGRAAAAAAGTSSGAKGGAAPAGSSGRRRGRVVEELAAAEERGPEAETTATEDDQAALEAEAAGMLDSSSSDSEDESDVREAGKEGEEDEEDSDEEDSDEEEE